MAMTLALPIDVGVNITETAPLAGVIDELMLSFPRVAFHETRTPWRGWPSASTETLRPTELSLKILVDVGVSFRVTVGDLTLSFDEVGASPGEVIVRVPVPFEIGLRNSIR